VVDRVRVIVVGCGSADTSNPNTRAKRASDRDRTDTDLVDEPGARLRPRWIDGQDLLRADQPVGISLDVDQRRVHVAGCDVDAQLRRRHVVRPIGCRTARSIDARLPSSRRHQYPVRRS
jgi:hypothetical protein